MRWDEMRWNEMKWTEWLNESDSMTFRHCAFTVSSGRANSWSVEEWSKSLSWSSRLASPRLTPLRPTPFPPSPCFFPSASPPFCSFFSMWIIPVLLFLLFISSHLISSLNSWMFQVEVNVDAKLEIDPVVYWQSPALTVGFTKGYRYRYGHGYRYGYGREKKRRNQGVSRNHSTQIAPFPGVFFLSLWIEWWEWRSVRSQCRWISTERAFFVVLWLCSFMFFLLMPCCFACIPKIRCA